MPDISSLLSLLTTGASAMNPIGLGLGVAGLGLEAAGAAQGVSASNTYKGQVQDYANTVNPLNAAKTQQDIRQARDQQAIEAANQSYMEMANKRASLENLRKTQQASAQATIASGTDLFGSASKSRQGNIATSGALNQQALGQGLQTGRNIFASNADISQARIAQFGIENQISQANVGLQTAQANYQASGALGKGLGSLGGSLMSVSGSKLFS